MAALSLINLIITIALIIGGVAAYRHGFTRTANEVQARVISALQSEIQALHDRIGALEKENTRLSYTLTTMCHALKQRGIHVTIDGDIVSIQDRSGKSFVYNTRVHGMQEER
jgi:cell division protein FtsB